MVLYLFAFVACNRIEMEDMNMNKDATGYVFNGIGAVFSAIQTNEVLSIVSWCITILATLLSIAFNIYRWYRKASEDGKITKEEVDELIDGVSKDIEEVKKNGKD